MDRSNYLYKVLISGVGALIVAMGIGRFAYTPILPLMENAKLFSEQGAGYLASANYFGYLIGAILAGLLKWRRGKPFYLSVHIIVSVITTIAVGLTIEILPWYILRFVSGYASGIIFVLASSIVIDTLNYYKRPTLTGVFYSGVGTGIFISGLFVPLFAYYFNWQGAWIGIGLVGAIIGLIVIFLVKDFNIEKNISQTVNKSKHLQYYNKSHLKYLLISYGCEGVGYIVSATFLVALVQRIPSLSKILSLSWVLVGLAAAPSCYIWSLIAKRYGNLRTLQIAYFFQVVGVLLPALIFNTIGALLGAFLFGATFMGITTLFMAEVRNYAQQESNKIISYFTFVYGIGQMIGPAVAGTLIARSGNYNLSLYFAATVLVIGMIFLSVVQFKIRSANKRQFAKVN